MSRRDQLDRPSRAEAPEPRERESAAARAPDALTAEGILALQRVAGNRSVGRLLARSPSPPQVAATTPALPSITHLSPMAQTLLEGALEKTGVDAAVRQIYDNMFTKTGWTYNASVANTSGPSYISGGKTSGMCESYRNAFAEILKIYGGLRATHP
ncbi:MAG: hypothetical protein QOE28_2473, partial [Solirubrobacteraceae bacterium]|nr:hypothetical protein [Solirubrobacteraceae bacterium]